ncbi:MAG: phycobilisome rod-core linker polypeptide [Prochlorococcaceae cyanobacterium]
MALPLLDSRPSAINARVANFLLAGDETSRQAPVNLAADSAATDVLIEQAYRQIFFHAFSVDRDPMLEMRLRSGQISTRGFIRGLLRSDKFRNDFYRCNSNYRVVEQLVGRVLGRPVYGEEERIRWSIVIAEQGLPAFVDALLESPEYLEQFGEDQVPFQRSRVLAGRAVGERPFNQQAPRYDGYWRDVMARRAPAGGSPWGVGAPRPAWLAGQPTPQVRQIWQAIVATGGFIVTGILLWTAAAMLSTGGQG